MAAAIGAGLGSIIILGAIGGYCKFHQFKKRALEKWTLAEESRFNEVFQTTHDFEKLCAVVPNRSRESVAYRAKLLLNPAARNSFNLFVSMKNVYREPKPRYAFVSERRIKKFPSTPSIVKKITKLKSSGSNNRNTTRTTATHNTSLDSSSTFSSLATMVELPVKRETNPYLQYNARNPLFYSAPRSPEPSY